jgi:superfamily II DNA or RNA helicase
MFNPFKNSSGAQARWYLSHSQEGLRLSQNALPEGKPLGATLVDGYLTQLVDEGTAIRSGEFYDIVWGSFYETLADARFAGFLELLELPPISPFRPQLLSANSLTDRDFSIALSGWREAFQVFGEWEQVGAVIHIDGNPYLMAPAHWQLYRDIARFAKRSSEERTELHNRQGWGRIRKAAIAADAAMDDFLYRSVVISPDRLEIKLRRSQHVLDDRLVEIEPTFTGAPAGWLQAFDDNKTVRDRYDIVTPEGIVQVLVTPAVRTVLQEIRKLPGRRIAGSRAQAFLLNPYATLGDAANAVIDEAQFERAREGAGLNYERFVPVYERDATGYPLRVGLLIDTATSQGLVASETDWLDDKALANFIKTVEAALSMNYQLIAWNGYDLEVQGDTARYLDELKVALEARRVPPTLVSYAQVHDLSVYSTRIEGIGVEKPYYSPFIAKKKDEDGWFPENVLPVVVYQPDGESEPVAVPADEKAMAELRTSVKLAKSKGAADLSVSWLPRDLKLSEAEEILSVFDIAFTDIKRGNFDPTNPKAGVPRSGSRKSLLLRANIGTVEYEERRQEALSTFPTEPRLPKSLRPEYPLLPHQREGLAWLQHRFNLQQEFQVRGVILGDDMGLGKTLQLLALMAWILEKDPGTDPMLIVAPVSLLENWAQEAEKFFVKGSLPILTAYGESLGPLRVPRAQIENRLLEEDGLIKFLKPNWTGGAKVVLTTYETLRDLEFSFATQHWSLMVCDEAQRIKNPAAMVTRSVKKQNVGFKIACSGTPVENTLADMWSLFDYVQPGLLGALNDFGRRYRKPIEAKTEEEQARVEELRTRIAPQILRRMKHEVAKNLPNKIVDQACRRLPLSTAQRNLYAKAIENFKNRNANPSGSMFKNHFGLLHHLRLVCTDPRPHGLNVFKPEPIDQYRRKAPKLNWLLEQLLLIKRRNEKAIVFCEFTEIQRLLKHYIAEALGYTSDIINGQTSASASHVASRQKRIKAFQEAPGFGVFILSPVAVGFGVNIQAANHVIHYMRTWNPAKEDQATDRAYRIGQQKDVFVYYPSVCADDFVTFDMKLDQLLTYKRTLAEDMLNGSGDVRPGDFNIADVVPESDAEALDERVTLDTASRMDGHMFEALTCVLWTKKGFRCYLTPKSHDNGIDVVALGNDSSELIQAKSSAVEGKTLGWDAIKEVVGGTAFYQRIHPTINFDRVCITNQFFNSQAKENAALNLVALLDQGHLAGMLDQHKVMLLEVEKVRYAETSDGYQ